MRGHNTIRINQSTAIEAFQEYFDKRTTDDGKFKIESIEWANDSMTFSIETKEIDDTGGDQ